MVIIVSSNNELSVLFDEIVETAKRRGMKGEDIAQSAAISPSSFSRAKKADDIYFSTLQKIAKGVGLKLALIPDTDIASDIQRGELFK